MIARPADLKTKRAAAEAIKESVEILHTAEYPEFLRNFFDPLVAVLSQSQPQFEDSEAAKLRHTSLEVLARLPHNEAFKPFAPRLAELCLMIMRNDNQQNALVRPPPRARMGVDAAARARRQAGPAATSPPQRASTRHDATQGP